MDATYPTAAELLALQALNCVDDARLEVQLALAEPWRSDQAGAYREELLDLLSGLARLDHAIVGVRSQAAALAAALA